MGGYKMDSRHHFKFASVIILVVFTLLTEARGSLAETASHSISKRNANPPNCSVFNSGTNKTNFQILPSETIVLSCECEAGDKEKAVCPDWTTLTNNTEQKFNMHVIKTQTPDEKRCNSTAEISPKSSVSLVLLIVACSVTGRSDKFAYSIKSRESRYDEACIIDTDCTGERYQCSSTKRCECNQNHTVVVEGDPNRCYKGAHPGEPCEYQVQCLHKSANTSCAYGVCECLAPYKRKDNSCASEGTKGISSAAILTAFTVISFGLRIRW